MDTSAYTSVIFGLFSSAFFWIFIIGGMILAGVLLLIIKKHRSLNFRVFEFLEIGRGKVNINVKSNHPLFRGKLKSGWFGNKSRFMGLWDYGPSRVMKTNDGREIRGVSTKDFHEINGKTAVLVERSPLNPSVLVPIKNVRLEGGEIFNKVAPIDLTGAGAEILLQNDRELKDRLGEILQVVGIIGVGLIILFAVIMTYNYSEKQTTEANRYAEEQTKQAGQILTNAGQANIETIKYLCSQLNEGETITSSEAP